MGLLRLATLRYSVRLSLQSGYGTFLITPSSRRIEFLPRDLPNSYLGNQKYPPSYLKILREHLKPAHFLCVSPELSLKLRCKIRASR